MTRSEAEALTAKLLAAFPTPKVESLTAQVYLERMELFPSYERALQAVNDLIGSEAFRPPVSLVVEAYNNRDEIHRKQILELDEVPPTPEERAANLKMAREWQYEGKLKDLTDSFEMP
jgi:hypothetical protein